MIVWIIKEIDFGKIGLGTADDGSIDNYKSAKENWKVMKFDHLSMGKTPHDIEMDLKK